jgi:hypothetical protein
MLLSVMSGTTGTPQPNSAFRSESTPVLACSVSPISGRAEQPTFPPAIFRETGNTDGAGAGLLEQGGRYAID